MRWSDSRTILGCGALGSAAAVLAIGASAAMLAPDLYLQVAQEDEIVEWATFWSLTVAGALLLRRRWFGVAVALFCFVVAMEEISWGQRLFGLRPPQYFLEHNSQQELNAHNLLPTIARKLAMSAVLAGYGIVLPLLRRWPRTRLLLGRFGIHGAPLALVPVFMLTLLLHLVYPIKLTGEWVELLLGLGFLFSALAARSRSALLRTRAPTRLMLREALVVVGVILVSAASAGWSRHARTSSPAALTMARSEVEALRADVEAAGLPDRDRLHVRAHAYATRYAKDLDGGRFAALTAAGLPEDRARYFLDPWNAPYWVKVSPVGDATGLLVYSFGANRVRETEGLLPGGDDVGLRVELHSNSSRGDPVPASDETKD